jgi:lipoprotein-anchoring transpeptidase ErfK/SrfK
LIACVLPLGQASAQYYPAYPDRYGPPAPYRTLPSVEFDDEEPLPPGQSDGRITQQPLPPPGQEGYALPPPGFVYPDRDRAVVPAPYGHIPGQEMKRGDIAPGEGPPRPPLEINPGQQPGQSAIIASLPPEDQPEVGQPKELPPQFRRQLVDYRTKEPAGTIIIDTANTYLYLVLGDGKAMRYGIGVGREGFTWAGTERVSRMAEWPDWHPPAEMIERQPYLPRFMAGGDGNPLGARALYLGKTLYRIHGTNQPSTIGSFVSSGCVRLVNDDIADLYQRVQVGTRVVVLPGGKPPATAQAIPSSAMPEAR